MAVQTLHLINDDSGPKTLKSRAGDVFQLSAYVSPQVGNVGGGNINLALACTDSTGVNAPTTVQCATQTALAAPAPSFDAVGAGYRGSSAAPTLAHTISGNAILGFYSTAGAGTTAPTLKVGSTPMTLLARFDNYTANAGLYVYGLLNPPTGAQTITGGTSTAIPCAVNTVSYNNVGSFGTAIKNTGLAANPSQTVSGIPAGQMVAQVFADSSVSYTAYSQTLHYNAAFASGVNYPMIVGDASGGSTLTFGATGGAAGASCAIAVPILPATTLWSSLSGAGVVPTGYDTVDPQVQLSGVPTTDTIFVDDVLVRETSNAYNISNALWSASTPGSAIASGQVPGLDASKIITGALAAARVGSLPASQITSGTFLSSFLPMLGLQQGAGTNLVLDPGFENAGYWPSAPGSQSTAQAHGGTNSWMLTGTAGQVILQLANTDVTAGVKIHTAPGEIFQMGAWVYPKVGNTTTGKVNLCLLLSDSTGVHGATLTSVFTNVSALIAGAWNYISASITVPANYDTIQPQFRLDATIPVGDIYYIDDVLVREVSLVQATINALFTGGAVGSSILPAAVPGLDASKIITGALAAARVGSLPASQITSGTFLSSFLPAFGLNQIKGTNLVLDPGFENASMWAHAGAGAQSTDFAHGGTHSWKLTGTGGNTALYMVQNDAVQLVLSKTAPGEIFQMGAWVYPAAANVGGGTVYLYLQCIDSTGVNATTNVLNSWTASTLTKGAWNHLTANATIPAGYDTFYALFQINSFTSGDIYYVDDILLREVTLVQSTIAALFSGGAVGSSILPAAVPGLDASKIITGLLGAARIGGLPTSQITSGTFAQTMITGLTSLWTSWFGTATPTGTSLLNAANVASLDASKIATGTFAQTMVSGLTSLWNSWFGTTTPTGASLLNAANVATLDASKIGTGTFAQTMVSGLTSLWNSWFGTTAPTGSSLLNAANVAALDASKIISGVLASAQVPNISAGTGLGQSSDLLTHLTNVAAQTGATGSSAVTAAQAALQTQANTLADVASKVQQQQTSATGDSQSGQSFFVNFASYPAGPFSAAPFTTTYGNIPGASSHGSGALVLSNGQAQWSVANDGDVSALGIYNAADVGGPAYTNTDYQKLSASLGGYPNNVGSKNFAILRANAAGTDYVYGVVYLNSSFQLCWEIGCYISGVQHVWDSGINAPLNLNFTFIAGVGTNANRYQGYSGGTLVFDHVNSSTDSGGVYPVGSTHRYWGFRSDTANNGQTYPAPAAYVGCADNQPPTIPGSGIRLYRTSTASVAHSTAMGIATFSGNTFFDTISENSSDLTQLTTMVGSARGDISPVVKVANAGRYLVSIRSDVYSVTCGAGAVSICPAVIRYNSAGTQQEIRLLPGNSLFINGFASQYDAGFFGASEVIACQAGDYLCAGYYLANGPTTGGVGTLSALSFTGDASGGHTFFEVTLANWSFN